MIQHHRNMPKSKITEVTNKVEDVKLVMHENIEKAAQNCIKLETLNEKSEELMVEAGVFQTNAKNLKNKMWWKEMKMRFIVGGIIAALIIIIVSVVYSYSSQSTTTT